jgi:hypothetical protein
MLWNFVPSVLARECFVADGAGRGRQHTPILTGRVVSMPLLGVI